MSQHIFTFGGGHPYWNRYVVIQADSPDRARDAMFEAYGSEWAFQYTEKEFSDSKRQGFFLNLESLPTIFRD